MKSVFWALLALLSFAGCDHVDADHPYDPLTPVAERTPGRLQGVLLFPEGTPADYTNVTTTLLPADIAHGDPRTLPGSIDREGQFVFDALPPGSYRLSFLADRFLTNAITVQVVSGEVVNLGLITLEPRPLGSITGFVEVAGRTDFSGVVITSEDGTQAVTAANGRYDIQVPAGPAQLYFSLSGYLAPAFAQPLRVTEPVLSGRSLRLDRKIRLEAKPGVVSGVVSLRQFETEERIEDVVACLAPGSAATCDGDGALAMTLTDDRISAEEVPVGAYTVVVNRPGYDTYTRPLEVAPEAHTDLGLIELSHQSTGEDARLMRGVVTDVNGPLAGIRIECRIPGKTSVFFETVVTDFEGVFEVQASADDTYTLGIDHVLYQIPPEIRVIYSADDEAFVIETEEGTEPLAIELEEKE